uniref:Uncharacterized protein n=1 Tax=Oryza punctata TaxID=4537 RepID=A0A0E0LSP6_ORYPU
MAQFDVPPDLSLLSPTAPLPVDRRRAASWGCAFSAAGGSGSGRHGLRGIGDGRAAGSFTTTARSTVPSPRSLRGDQRRAPYPLTGSRPRASSVGCSEHRRPSLAPWRVWPVEASAVDLPDGEKQRDEIRFSLARQAALPLVGTLPAGLAAAKPDSRRCRRLAAGCGGDDVDLGRNKDGLMGLRLPAKEARRLLGWRETQTGQRQRRGGATSRRRGRAGRDEPAAAARAEGSVDGRVAELYRQSMRKEILTLILARLC